MAVVTVCHDFGAYDSSGPEGEMYIPGVEVGNGGFTSHIKVFYKIS